ncbi:Uncharacterized protein Rs2_46943 [Raphanus sativus]|nr:Uncharacterized protein Rs2_46943 [Raphanus sativus]
MAKAEARAAQIEREAVIEGTTNCPIPAGEQNDPFPRVSNHCNQNREGEHRGGVYRFSASEGSEKQARSSHREDRDFSTHRPYKSQTRVWQERSSNRQSSQARERARHEHERSSRPPRSYYNQKKLPEPTSRSYYREVSRRIPDNKETGSSSSKLNQDTSAGGIPPQGSQTPIPQEVLDEARGELMDYINQYTKSADPTEREARIERMRQAEEQGEMEETAIQMARTSLLASAENQRKNLADVTPERIPASQRLGSATHISAESGRNSTVQILNSQERVPVMLRLGPSTTPPQLLGSEGVQQLNSTERIPATQRLGPILTSPDDRTQEAVAVAPKRKPGRPPGRKAQENNLQGTKPAPKNRRVTQKKNSPARRKSPSNAAAGSKSKPKSRTGTSRGGAQDRSAI